MANNKVQLSNGTVIIDLTSDTVTSASHIKSGLVGHLADGTIATGTLVEKDVKSVTYNLSGGATASIATSEVVTSQGFSVKLTAPTGYVLSGVTVTMGGNDITSQVFTPDEEGGGGGGTPAISVVDTTDSHGGTVREITALDISDTTAEAGDVTQGKYFYTAQGVKTAGTGSGGTPSATQHSIYFEFSDSTNTTINAWYDDSFISNAITATEPTTYGGKTVDSASLDNVVWYTRQIETWETLFDATYSVENGGFWLAELGSIYPTEGSVWRITLDGIQYVCIAEKAENQWGATEIVVGNPVYAGYSDDGSSTPCCFINRGYGAWNGFSSLSDGNYTIKIERQISA